MKNIPYKEFEEVLLFILFCKIFLFQTKFDWDEVVGYKEKQEYIVIHYFI